MNQFEQHFLRKGRVTRRSIMRSTAPPLLSVVLPIFLIGCLQLVLPVSGQQCPCSSRVGLLRTFYDATGGDVTWVPAARWNFASPTFPCNASGITCTGTPVNDITEMLLSQKGLSGTLPAVISNLTALTWFDVSHNSIGGTLPAEFSAWTALRIMDCSSNQMNGSLPSSWGAWATLQVFSVRDNRLTGQLPRDYSAWGASVQAVYVDYNRLSGPLPSEYKNWTAVVLFAATNNSISGQLPGEYSAWTNITRFDLGQNSLSGSLPPSYAVWTQLTTLVASSNMLTGTLSPDFRRWSNLSTLQLTANSFTGSLPEDYKVWKKLTYFALGSNSLTGTLPPAYSAWNLLIIFEVNLNSVDGTLPAEYGLWHLLLRFNVQINNITGTLPSSYGNWSNAYLMRFGNNQLTGSLPSEYGGCRALQAFGAEHNRLSGTLPSTYSHWTSMSGNVALNNNEMNGTLPPELSSWKSVMLFTIDENNVTGQLPSSWRSWTKLISFSVVNNLLSGTLPSEYAEWRSIKDFTIYGNRISGTLPPEYSAWPSISTARFDSNSLTGSLPSQYSKWTTVTRLFLYTNSLSGTLPSAYILMTSLQSFQASDNRLTGSIPVQLVSIPSLTTLTVGYNQLSGPLPSSCSSNLRVFSFQNNTRVSGSIPPQLPSTALISVCGTGVCPKAGWGYQYCVPRTFSFSTTSVTDLFTELSLYYRLCTSAAVLQNTRTISLKIEPSNAPQQSASTVSAPTRATTSAATYTALLTTGSALPRGALPGLQRSSSVLRMMGACNAPGSESTAPMYSALADNPLALPVTIGVTDLESSAGAALGNAILVIAIAVGLHVCSAIQGRLSRVSTNASGRSIIAFLPSSLLPGSLAIAYGTLLQPSLGACVALMASVERSPETVAYGALFFMLWLGLPAYCLWAVVWRGRRMTNDGRFALESIRCTHSTGAVLRRQQKAPLLLQALRNLRVRVMEPTHLWVRRSNCGATQAATEFLLENLEPVFGGYVGGREWYSAVQWVSAAASGVVLGALQVIGNDDAALACPTAYAGCGVAIAFGVSDIILTAVLRPMTVPLEMWTGAVVSFLCIVSQALAAANSLDASNTVVTVSALIEVVVMVSLMFGGGKRRISRSDRNNDSAKLELAPPRSSTSTPSATRTTLPKKRGNVAMIQADVEYANLLMGDHASRLKQLVMLAVQSTNYQR